MGSRLRGMLRLPAALVVIAIALGPPLADHAVNCNRRTGKDAIAGCTELIRRNPQDAVAYFNRGFIHGELGESDAAIADFTRAIEFNPNFAGAYHMRGFVFDEKGEYERAIADYTRAIEIDPQFARAYNSRGVTHRAKGDVDPAIADYTKALELNPTDADVYNNRGAAYPGVPTTFQLRIIQSDPNKPQFRQRLQ